MTVETALAMPLMVFLALGIIQLTALQQARIMTEYAAFQAARAGIVWSGNNARMHDAARMALLPTLGRTDSLVALGRTWAQSARTDQALHQALLPASEGKVPDAFRTAGLLGMVRVDTLSPSGSTALGQLWTLRGGALWQELDLDGPDTFPESPELEEHVARFFDLKRPDAQQELYRRATVLTVRVRYLYELRVPFASWILFTSWFAANGGQTLHGAIDRPTLEPGNALAPSQSLQALPESARGVAHEEGLSTITPEEMAVLWRLSQGEGERAPDAPARGYFIPLSATYSLRMQSNFHRKWLMHGEEH